MPPEQADSRPVRSARLVWKEDSGSIKEYILNRGTLLTIGREVGNQILLTNPKVSKHHAEIRGDEKSFKIQDLGSTNGVFVNGVQIQAPTELRDNDRIEIGDHVLTFALLRQPEPADLSTRRLADLESTMDMPMEQVMTQALPASPPQPAAEFRTQILMEAEPPEPPMPPEPKAPRSTPVAVPAAPPSAPPAPALAAEPAAAAPRSLEADFDELLQNLGAAQARSAALKQKGVAFRDGVEDVIAQLRQVTGGMQALEAEAEALKLQALLTQLNTSPNDVKLLLDLAGSAALLSRLYLGFVAHSRAVQKAEQGLEEALKDYRAGS